MHRWRADSLFMALGFGAGSGKGGIQSRDKSQFCRFLNMNSLNKDFFLYNKLFSGFYGNGALRQKLYRNVSGAGQYESF